MESLQPRNDIADLVSCIDGGKRNLYVWKICLVLDNSSVPLTIVFNCIVSVNESREPERGMSTSPFQHFVSSLQKTLDQCLFMGRPGSMSVINLQAQHVSLLLASEHQKHDDLTGQVTYINTSADVRSASSFSCSCNACALG